MPRAAESPSSTACGLRRGRRANTDGGVELHEDQSPRSRAVQLRFARPGIGRWARRGPLGTRRKRGGDHGRNRRVAARPRPRSRRAGGPARARPRRRRVAMAEDGRAGGPVTPWPITWRAGSDDQLEAGSRERGVSSRPCADPSSVTLSPRAAMRSASASARRHVAPGAAARHDPAMRRTRLRTCGSRRHQVPRTVRPLRTRAGVIGGLRLFGACAPCRCAAGCPRRGRT